MCKLFMMTEPPAITSKLLGVIKDAVCGVSEKDGFGYAILGESNEVGGERTDQPEDFKALGPAPETLKISKVPGVAISYNRFGTIKTHDAKALIAHGRFSTNELGLANAHPFVSDENDLALVHNGVVTDATGLTKGMLRTKCDTEVLLRYWQLGGMKQIEANVSGYYALGVLEQSSGLLHIVRDDKATLYITHSKTVNSFMFATTAEILETVAKEMKWKIEPPQPIVDCKYLVFDGNEVVEHSTIVPVEGVWSPLVDKSLGVEYGKGRYANDDEPWYRESGSSNSEFWRNKRYT